MIAKKKEISVNLLQNNWDKFNYTWHKISAVEGYSSLLKIKLQGETLLTKQLKCNNNFFIHFNLTSWVLVCLEIFVPLIWRRHHCLWRAAGFIYLCSTLVAIKQWGFFSVSHLLWQGASVYYSHLRGPVTLTPNAERCQWSYHYQLF